MKLVPVLVFTLAACGGASTPPVATPAPALATPEPVAAPAPPPAPEPASAAAPPPAEAAPEVCDGQWVCVKVNLATRKVEKRDTKLMGDPKIASTWSKTSDGRTATFDEFSKGPVELTLKRLPRDKSEVQVKLAKGGAPIVIDKHDGSLEDFTHVGAIAAEQDGALLVDMRYLR